MTLARLIDSGQDGRVVEQIGCSYRYRLIRVYSDMAFANPSSLEIYSRFVRQMPKIPPDERRDLIFDFERVLQIDSGGLAYLLKFGNAKVWLGRKARERLGRKAILKPRRLVICCAGQRIMHQFQILGVEKAFEFYDSTGQALEQYQ